VADMNGDQMPDILFSWPPPGSVTAQRGIGELFSLGLQAPDYTVGPAPGTPTSQTVSPGQTANFTLALTPSSSFNGTVTLSCAITPLVSPAPSCALSNSSVQLTGSAAQQITVTVGTTALSAASIMPSNWPPVSGAFIGVALGLMCLSAWGHRMKPALAGTVALG